MSALDTTVHRLAATLLARGQRLTVAESCTGGGIAAALPDLAGSSQWFERGFVVYSNESKAELLGVAPDTLITQGAVSEATVTEMARGALAHSPADWALAVSGIAGPDGGSAEKPVGTVCFAWAGPLGWSCAETRHFAGDRAAVRQQSVVWALERLQNILNTV